MTSDPSVPRPGTTSQGVPLRPKTQEVTISEPAQMVLGIITVALGIALGLANQSASDTAMGLRVPALLAALLMVGQGIVNIRKSLPRQEHIEVMQEGGGARGRELAVVHSIPNRAPASPASVRPTPATLSVPIVVLLLAAWLGLADLRVSAPPVLSVLSLVAAFALFALGWGLLPARR
jgi:vacuolar-type H+-ATPase subunit I/STV1